MKALRIIIASAAMLALATSCLDDQDAYNAGFFFRKPTTALTGIFANNTIDTVSFISYGNWMITRDATYSGNGWCQFTTTSGKGNSLYTIPVTFLENVSGQGRGVQLNFSDTDHPGDGRSAVVFWQYATRGDGSLGFAAEVKAVSGSDGSRFEMAYDALHRPTSLRITKDDALVRSLSIAYDDYDSIMTVKDMSKTLKSYYTRDFQPQRLIGDGDTIGYFSQYYDMVYPVSANHAFNIEHRSLYGGHIIYAIKLGGQSLAPDSLHCADSLRIARTIQHDTDIAKYKLTFSRIDNRCQTIDANQLVFGADECDPYQLLSLFRYARNTSIVSKLEDGNNSCDVTVKLNADNSIAEMTVARKQPLATTVTYTFDY